MAIINATWPRDAGVPRLCAACLAALCTRRRPPSQQQQKDEHTDAASSFIMIVRNQNTLPTHTASKARVWYSSVVSVLAASEGRRRRLSLPLLFHLSPAIAAVSIAYPSPDCIV